MATWILVANSAHSLLYSSDNLRVDGLHLLQEFFHPESRKKITDLVCDRPGHFATDNGGHGAFTKGSPKEVEAEHFALQLVKELKDGFEKKRFNDLIIVSPAHFHSLIKKHIDPNLADHTIIFKDYTKYPLKKLTEALKEHLFGR